MLQLIGWQRLDINKEWLTLILGLLLHCGGFSLHSVLNPFGHVATSGAGSGISTILVGRDFLHCPSIMSNVYSVCNSSGLGASAVDWLPLQTSQSRLPRLAVAWLGRLKNEAGRVGL